MTYSISCVLLIPSVHRDAINAVAEALGYGPDNLSVELLAADGSVWYGCHTWAEQAFLDMIASPPPEVAQIPGGPEALAALVVSSLESGDPGAVWHAALEASGMKLVAPQEGA